MCKWWFVYISFSGKKRDKRRMGGHEFYDSRTGDHESSGNLCAKEPPRYNREWLKSAAGPLLLRMQSSSIENEVMVIEELPRPWSESGAEKSNPLPELRRRTAATSKDSNVSSISLEATWILEVMHSKGSLKSCKYEQTMLLCFCSWVSRDLRAMAIRSTPLGCFHAQTLAATCHVYHMQLHVDFCFCDKEREAYWCQNRLHELRRDRQAKNERGEINRQSEHYISEGHSHSWSLTILCLKTFMAESQRGANCAALISSRNHADNFWHVSSSDTHGWNFRHCQFYEVSFFFSCSPPLVKDFSCGI